MAKTKNKIWNKGLFLEGILQTKWIAFATFIMILFNILLVTQKIVWFMYEDSYYFISSISVAIMILKLFGFLNKREGSDFYYGLSHNRISLYVSYGTSVLFWGVIIILFQYLSGLLLIDDSIYFDKILEFHDITLYSVAGLILVAGAALLAMSLSGNRFTNIALVLFILFVPRILLFTYVDAFCRICPFLPVNDFIFRIINPSYNIISSQFDLYTPIVYSIMDYDSLYAGLYGFDSAYVSMKYVPVIYSSVLGVIYMIIGGGIFVRRKSEYSGRAVISNTMMFIIKLAIFITLSVIPINTIVEWCLSFVIPEATHICFDIVIMYGIAILVWIVIDVVVCKKVYRPLKDLWRIGIAFGVNVLICAVFVICAWVSASNIPEVDEVELVRVSDGITDEQEISNNLNDTGSQISMAFYPKDFIKQIEIKNDESIKAFTDILARDMDSYINNYYWYKDYTESTRGALIEVEFVTDNGVIKRKIYDDENIDVIGILMSEAEETYEYECPITEYSESNNIDASSYLDYYGYGEELKNDELIDLYNVMYEEINTLELPMSIYMGSVYANKRAFAYIGKSETDYSYEIPITVDMPKTLQKYMELTGKGIDKDYVDKMNPDEPDGIYRSMTISLYNKEKDSIELAGYYWDNSTEMNSDKALCQKLQEIYSADENKKISTDGHVMAVRFWYRNRYVGCYWSDVSDAELDELMKLEIEWSAED